MKDENLDPGEIRGAWAAAWTAAWAELSAVVAGRKAEIPTKSGGRYEYSYASLGDVLDAARSVLGKHGLAVSQEIVRLDETTIGVETHITHAAGGIGSFGPTPMPAAGDPRSIGSSITYARRYALAAALGISTDGDDDGASAQAPRTTSAPDLHDQTWQAVKAIGRSAGASIETLTDEWKAALSAAGVPEGGRIATDEQADLVVNDVEMSLDPDGPPGGGYDG